jgi:uncharacterized membrane protein YdbT with pleckstrin-like domain
MVRNHPFLFVVSLLLIFPSGIGLLILLGMWLTTKSETITIDEEKTIIRKGLIAKHTSEVFHHDVVSVEVSQNIINRMFGVGALQLGSAASKISIKGIRNPQQVKEICNSLKKNHVVMVRQVL